MATSCTPSRVLVLSLLRGALLLGHALLLYVLICYVNIHSNLLLSTQCEHILFVLRCESVKMFLFYSTPLTSATTSRAEPSVSVMTAESDDWQENHRAKRAKVV
jgi:hypothetical protein